MPYSPARMSRRVFISSAASVADAIVMRILRRRSADTLRYIMQISTVAAAPIMSHRKCAAENRPKPDSGDSDVTKKTPGNDLMPSPSRYASCILHTII